MKPATLARVAWWGRWRVVLNDAGRQRRINVVGRDAAVDMLFEMPLFHRFAEAYVVDRLTGKQIASTRMHTSERG